MSREEVVEFIQKETNRLRQEEHIDELLKSNDIAKLVSIEIRTTSAISDFLYNDAYIGMLDEEIAEGNCMAVVIWARALNVWSWDLVVDLEKFAHRLAREGGGYGKNIAVHMLDGEKELSSLTTEEFFSTMYTEEYDEKYGLMKKF